MLPDNVAISSSIQMYLDLGYDPEVAVNKAARADHLSRRRKHTTNVKELIERDQISADCCRWASQRYKSND
ncbi:hypothetical protein [Microseira sp. BLCC-F43]|jgi:hypothetical protein|uniref:hypothetical protein n=1 Tax=Microseira sp. BLCC-F43 TaxID=3153602 RepID=UPI0035BAB4E5